ncbi:MAG: BatD family protein [Thermoanaerobaculia bacterium]
MRRFAILLLLIAPSAAANDLLVDHRTLQMNDLLTITVSLEGAYAGADEVPIPLRNLAFIGEPSVSSEFAWINGNVTRRKVFRYRARPLAPGPAQVGPIVVNSDDGQRDTLRAIAIQIIADVASGSNDPAVVLRELRASGREPLFVVAEIDKQSAYVGEPVNVTWWLYNAASVQQWQVAAVPKLEDFWVEERSRNESPERVYAGDTMMQRMAVRRVALFPLQSGTLRIGGVTVDAAVMRASRRGPFAMFEGELIETTFTSAAIELQVKPLPPGPPVDAVGDLALTCEPPVQQNGGPIVLNVALTGIANLRAANAPRFAGNVAGEVQIEGGDVAVSREEASFGMARRWRYLIFPAQSGSLQVPPLTLRTFVPEVAARRELRCEGGFVNADLARNDGEAGSQPAVERSNNDDGLRARLSTGTFVLVALALIGLLFALPAIRRELKLRREVREILRDATPAEIRERIDARMHIDIKEPGERGDAYRALRSLLDAAERDRDIAVNAERDLARRVRDVLSSRGA